MLFICMFIYELVRTIKVIEIPVTELTNYHMLKSGIPFSHQRQQHFRPASKDLSLS